MFCRAKLGLVSGLAGAKVGLVSGLAGAKLGLVKSLAAPKIAIARGLIGAKSNLAKGLLGAKLGLARLDQLIINIISFDFKSPPSSHQLLFSILHLLRTVLRPVAGIKRAKLSALRGLLDRKISLLDF